MTEAAGTAVALHPHVIAIKHILCPTDFSDASRHAIEQAAAIARWYDARITLLHVAPSMSDLVPTLTRPIGEDDFVEGLDRIQERALEAVRQLEATGVPVAARVEAGLPWSHIVDRADDLDADLVVMGTHGATGFQHLVLGSVTEKVLRTVRRPVLTVPPRAQMTVTLPFKHVLCPLDFSPSSLAALQFAFSFAQEGQAALTLLHVIEWPWDEPPAPVFQDLPPREAANLAEFRCRLEADACGRLTALVPADVRNWCTPRLAVVHGKAHREVLRLATDAHADLIVIGFHGRNVVDRALFGSTTTQVVRRATCPVLTIRG